jgi:biopolymer transport protein ExbD
MLRRRHDRRPGGLDFTSLVDIALVLVVFFLLTAQARSVRLLPVSLPRTAGVADAPLAPGTLELTIAADGGLTCRGRPLRLADLPALAQGASHAVLYADAAARHGRVVAVIDALRRAGVSEVDDATSLAGPPPLQRW